MAGLVCCSSCSTYILPGEVACPFCGARQRSIGRTAGALAVGLTIGACGGDGNPNSETINSAAAYGVEETIGDTLEPTTTTPGTGTESSSGSESGSSGASESSGGTGGSDSSGSGTDTDTDTGSTSFEPDYGVPTTSG
jgi:hypothetical protein